MSTPKTKTTAIAMIMTTVTPNMVARVSVGTSSFIVDIDTLGSAVVSRKKNIKKLSGEYERDEKD